jgi:Zn-dependent M28 family amino/carboxypeptidase
MTVRFPAPLALLAAGLFSACAPGTPVNAPDGPLPMPSGDPAPEAPVAAAPDAAAGPLMLAEAPAGALAEIDSMTLKMHLEELASDAYEGRGTGTPGEAKTIAYVSEWMKAYGLQPGAPDGTFFQNVPLRGSTPSNVSPLVFTTSGGDEIALDFVDDFIAATDLSTDRVALEDVPMVFVGYGISNPGYDWDDYKDVDVSGKVLVGFVNDPPKTDAEPNLFQADTLTYNGRWTYKYEEARRRGAAGVFLIHTTPTAGYPFQVLQSGAAGEAIELATVPENPLRVKGWITQPNAERLMQAAGMTLNEAFVMAASRDFRPVELPATAAFSMDLTNRTFSGTNVIGVLPGTSRAAEAVAYTAHHDHLGIDREKEARGEDGIYNGAVDNASGVAMLLTLAKAHAAAPRSARSVQFLSLSAEESGLLGSKYYAENPSVALRNTIANVNVDSGNLDGETEDVVGIGAERSEMLALLRLAAQPEGLRVSMDQNPNQGLFFRSDQLAFARGGVPAIFMETGGTFRGKPAGYAAEREADYRATRYHQPADEVLPSQSYGGILQQTRVAFRLGYGIAANPDLRPQWKDTEAFAETRRLSEAD